ncbi:PHA/PHB synthase family protein [Patulibacter defluvii]|uniref:PHA/PHB synthase family protein n=1 Tax=Patulibacter defluvii TaxID=3095358 RepID=UPI002A750E8E|nr:alpha/beta fold hydrolase [Patulibacter sp. DM4]
MATTEPHADARRRGGRAALDVLLTETTSFGGASRFVQPAAAARTVAGLARQPGRAARRAAGLGGELSRIARGRSQLAPAKGDRRFGDRAWQENWMLRRLLQSYLAVGDALDGLISDADLDWRAERQARFMASNLMDAFAPTNFPLTNPAVLKETIDRGGANLVIGGRRLLRDVSRSPRLPATVDTSRFEVGGNLALTPGSIVLHTEVFELIQYAPTTETVHERPLLIVPPTINKYYVLDMAPGRSIVEHLVAQGQQVFMISWRNPDADHAHFDFDTYAAAVLEARQAVASISEQQSVHVAAACSGGILSAGAVGHLAASGRLGDVASLTLMVCALDNRQAGTTAAFTSRQVAAAAMAESARKGYLDGRSLAGVFAWLRPNDMIWGYVVNNYLLGKAPPAFDILYWNQDTVRLAAGLHRDFIQLALENDLVTAGARTVLGTPVSLADVELDSYVVAGSNDHIVPWENAYRSTQVLGGRPRFVLSTSGHIQALINPPSPDSRSSYRVSEEHPPEPEQWQEQAAKKRGSWWPDYVAWLAERSGDQRPAPTALGNDDYRATAKAPGIYVHAN